MAPDGFRGRRQLGARRSAGLRVESRQRVGRAGWVLQVRRLTIRPSRRRKRRGLTQALGLMGKNNVVPAASLALLVLAALYLWAISGQPRVADGGLSGDE